MKQSSIDWFIEQMDSSIDYILENNEKTYLEIFEEMKKAKQTAREMHRREIKEAYRGGMFSEGFENEKDYYTETFKQNDNKS